MKTILYILFTLMNSHKKTAVLRFVKQLFLYILHWFVWFTYLSDSNYI